jgi:streptogramin lyase
VWVKTAETVATRPGLVAVDAATNSVGLRFPELSHGEHTGVAVGDGSVWMANVDSGVISRRDARTGQVTARTDGPRLPTDLVFGDGSLWVLTGAARQEAQGPGSVVRIDPRTDRIVDSYVMGIRPRAIAFGLGAAWVANGDSSSVSRIDAASGTVTTIPLDQPPLSIAAGDAGVWVATVDGSVVRIDPARSAITGGVKLEGVPSEIGVDPADGSAWVTVPPEGAVVHIEG